MPDHQSLKVRPLSTRCWRADGPQLGWSRLLRDWDHKSGEAACRRATELNPSSATAGLGLAACLMVAGKTDEAVAEVDRALSSDPNSLDVAVAMSMTESFASRYSRAIEICTRYLKREPDFVSAHRLLGILYTLSGQYAKAAHHIQEAIDSLGDVPDLLADQCFFLAESGRSSEAARVGQRLKRLSKQRYVRSYTFARCASALGNQPETIKNLNAAFEEREPQMIFLRYDVRFRPLAQSAPFQELVSRSPNGR